MHDFARESPLLAGLRVEYIPNGIDTDLYKPAPKEVARIALDLPGDKKILSFVASNPKNPRKGFQHLPPIFEKLKDLPDLVLVVVGDAKPEQCAEIEKYFPVKYLNVIRDPRLMRLAYSASDLFLLPSEVDNLPNTMLESLACGTPVAAFFVGGMPDGVKNDETGFTAPLGAYDELALWIRRVLMDPKKAACLQENSRRFAVENFRLELQAARYAELYQSLLEQRRSL
jgi:glycosyltransferase involved in cell wall biosynthesis